MLQRSVMMHDIIGATVEQKKMSFKSCDSLLCLWATLTPFDETETDVDSMTEGDTATELKTGAAIDAWPLEG